MPRPEVKYQLPRCPGIIKPCIYKLYFEGKYIIVKAKDHNQSVGVISKSLNQFMRGSELQTNPSGLYYHFFKWVKTKKKGEFKIECLLESDNAYELLKVEQTAIDANMKDKNFLNNATEAYIPAYNEETRQYGWIPLTAVLSFKKWLKNRQSQ